MGLLSALGGAAGNFFLPGVGGALGGLLGGAIEGSGGSKQTGTQTTTNTQTMDPRVGGMLFGQDGKSGLLNTYQGMLNTPQNAGMATYGAQQDGYMGYNAGQDQNHIRETAYGQMQGNTPSPTMFGAGVARTEPMQGAQVNAPAQNGMNLSGSYDKFINGDAGANPYLTKSIQGGIDQSTNQFRQMQSEATDNLQRNVLGGIRSNSVLTGQYGGSRQGVAEGNAISDFTRQQQQAMTQFGQNNTNAAVGAQAQSFNQGQDRALAATQGLGAQQYGVASQNASQQQQANSTNYAGDLQTHLTQAGLDNSAQANNLQAAQGTNALNAQVKQQGVSNLAGVLGTAYSAGQNQDGYALNQAAKVNGLLSPYLGQVPGSSTTSQPLYQNQAGNLLGGAAAGLGLLGQVQKYTGGNSYNAGNWNTGGNDGYTIPGLFGGESMGT